MNMHFDDPDDKWAVLRAIKDELILKKGLVMDDVDEQKPWGAYYRFVLSEKEKFLELFYKDLDVDVPDNISPKFLVFAPGKKISLQYHERRDEIWKVLHGEVEAYYGEGDELGEYKTYKEGETFKYPALARHKGGASAKGWAIVAEIWKHTDQNNLSTEEDNTRISDDFGRV
jgi:mannose-6-phosphate isomerase-like protein (cupin superfamily)